MVLVEGWESVGGMPGITAPETCPRHFVSSPPQARNKVYDSVFTIF
jgi:hypothetical protein